MTKTEIKTTINKMRATKEEKEVLQKACDANDNNTLVAIGWLKARQDKNKEV